MKKILFSMLLMVSLKSFASDCTSYAGGLANFCPEVEIACFTNFVNNTDQVTLLNQATACTPVMNALNNANSPQDLINGASAIVNGVIHDFFFGGTTCNDLVNNYINYAQSNCPQSLIGQCQAYSKELSFGLSNCSTTASLVQGAISVYNNDVQPVVNTVESVGNTIASGVEYVENNIISGFCSLCYCC